MPTRSFRLPILLALLLPLIGALAAQSNSAPAPGREQRERREVPLTDAQKATVKALLAKYNPKALTADDIQAIRRAFREADLRGPTLDQAVREAGFDAEALRPPRPDGSARGASGKEAKDAKGGNSGNRPGFNIEQATSDRAQLHTLAYDGLAWLTGDFYCDTFLPPGKVSDFFGFQYLRDNDTAGMGHNTAFLTRIANAMMRLLTTEQKERLMALAREQEGAIRAYALKRFPLMKAFRRLLENDLPPGAKELSLDAVKKFSADLYQMDADLVWRRAEAMASVLTGFSAAQKKDIDAWAKGNWNTWPEYPEGDEKRQMTHDAHVAYSTYVSEMFAWYAGSVEADTYFCPEGIAKYFGAFYVKDAPAVRNPHYGIGTELTGEGGADFIKALTAAQQPHITGLTDRQRPILQDLVKTRRALATELRKFLAGAKPDRDLVTRLYRQYGEQDGEISWLYANGFSAVGRTLTAEQRTKLMKIRNLDAKYTPDRPFVYADPVSMPPLPSTDAFFK